MARSFSDEVRLAMAMARRLRHPAQGLMAALARAELVSDADPLPRQFLSDDTTGILATLLATPAEATTAQENTHQRRQATRADAARQNPRTAAATPARKPRTRLSLAYDTDTAASRPAGPEPAPAPAQGHPPSSSILPIESSFRDRAAMAQDPAPASSWPAASIIAPSRPSRDTIAATRSALRRGQFSAVAPMTERASGFTSPGTSAMTIGPAPESTRRDTASTSFPEATTSPQSTSGAPQAIPAPAEMSRVSASPLPSTVPSKEPAIPIAMGSNTSSTRPANTPTANSPMLIPAAATRIERVVPRLDDGDQALHEAAYRHGVSLT